MAGGQRHQVAQHGFSLFLRQVMTVRQGGARRLSVISRLRDPPESAVSHVVPNRQALSAEEMTLHDGL